MSWGVPDWREGAHYPDADATPDLVWRWEFLRRRPDYREEWQRQSAKGLIGKLPLAYAFAQDLHHARLHYGVECIWNPACQMTEDQLRMGVIFFNVAGHARIDTGSLAPEKAPWQSDEDFMNHLKRQSARSRAQADGDYEAGLIDFRFDLSKALEPQIQFARRALIHWQKERFGKKNTPRPRRENWPLYLRALDARDAGATYAEMARVLWPQLEKSEGSARDTHDAACRLRDNFPI